MFFVEDEFIDKIVEFREGVLCREEGRVILLFFRLLVELI